MGAKISQIEYFLPENIISNSDLEKEFGRWDADKIEKKIGIRQRHVVSNNETALDIAFKASEKALKNYDRNKIDFIILCTQSPDYYLPTSACILQDKLNLRKNIGAFDFNLGCSGYIYGLAIAKSFISSGIANNILLVTSETYSKHINKNDLANRTIFGDAAAATIIEKTEEENIFEFELGTDGSGMNNLIVPSGGLRQKMEFNPIEIKDESDNIRTNNDLFMNGPEIFNFTIKSVPTAFNNVLEKNNLNIDNIDYVIFHQANKYMIGYLRKKIGIPEEKFYDDILMTGNTVSATIPIALKNASDQGIIKSGDKVLLCGFGVGYSWGATIIKL